LLEIFSFLKEHGSAIGFSNKLVPGVAALKVAEKVMPLPSSSTLY
jgi:hypothetical protein